ncbi:MAG: dynamin family protein, partial [Planctomycetaceae bacterium]
MTNAELVQLELFAQVDELLRRLRQWGEGESPWEPLNHSRAVVRRLLGRLETLRIRLEAPLVVATFGGTGTGKSSLVNALIGEEVSRAGRERPTTRRPTLIAQSRTELESLNLSLEDFDIVRVNSPVLRDTVLIDCPDPDTNEAETSGSNLEILRQMLPHCDVLIYTSTQQKYRNARIVDELDLASTGCRLVFVQTHADVDSDIREDWRIQLDGRYSVPDLFFVDSVQALADQQAGQRPGGDFARLQDLLTTRLAAGERIRIRRANLLDLTEAALKRCDEHLTQYDRSLDELESGLAAHQQKMSGDMSRQL